MGAGLRSFPNRTRVFQLGGKRLGNVRKYSLSFISFPDSQPDKIVLGADFFLSPGHSPNSWKGWRSQLESPGPSQFPGLVPYAAGLP